MNKYISMLRGINVSGQKIIKMADLKSLYEALNFTDVVTYIQSGNVIFNTRIKNRADLKSKIESAISEKYGFHVPVIIRTNDEIADIMKHCPFGSVNLEQNGTKILLTFLSAPPAEADIANIQKYVVAPEKLIVRGKEVYLHCPNGSGTSKLSNNLIEQKLKVKATTRNWKSVVKLHELSS